jgi:hypothetical protein
MNWARSFATGLSSLRDRAASRLAGSRFNPSRICLTSFLSFPALCWMAVYLTATHPAFGLPEWLYVTVNASAWILLTRAAWRMAA